MYLCYEMAYDNLREVLNFHQLNVNSQLNQGLILQYIVRYIRLD